MTTLLVPGTAKTSLAIADLLAANSQPYILGVRSTTKPGPISTSTGNPHPTAHLDLADPSTWPAVFNGNISSTNNNPPIATLYLVPPPTIPDFVPILTNFIHAALRLSSGHLNRIVFLSASLIPLGGPAHGQIHSLLDELTRQGTLREYAVLRPTWFAQNFVTQGSLHRVTIETEATIYSATGPRKLAFVDVADIARVGWRAVIDAFGDGRGDDNGGNDGEAEPAQTQTQTQSQSQSQSQAQIETRGVHTSHNGRGREYLILGPQLLSYADVAAVLSDVSARNIEWVGLTVEDLARKLVEVLPIDPGYAPVLAGLDAHVAAGEEERLFEREKGGCVLGLLGRPARSLREVLREEVS